MENLHSAPGKSLLASHEVHVQTSDGSPLSLQLLLLLGVGPQEPECTIICNGVQP